MRDRLHWARLLTLVTGLQPRVAAAQRLLDPIDFEPDELVAAQPHEIKSARMARSRLPFKVADQAHSGAFPKSYSGTGINRQRIVAIRQHQRCHAMEGAAASTGVSNFDKFLGTI